MTRSHAVLTLSLAVIVTGLSLCAQNKTVTLTDGEKAIAQQVKTLRSVPDDQRGAVTKKLALEIRSLPISEGKLMLASGLANLSTEGDFGHDTLQEVTNTLSAAIEEAEKSGMKRELPYEGVARLVRYEGTTTSLNNPQYQAAMAEFGAADKARANANFSLADLQGKQWTLEDLKGKVVLVNFWATWCPPCRKEIADLERIQNEFGGKGLVVLGVSDDDLGKLREFSAKQKINYPVLPDPDRKVHKALRIEGIPATLIYDRDGKLVAQAVDMRTRDQFLRLLARAGLK